jgi:hypothetical protein
VATVDELKDRAAELDIEGRSSMSKDELEAAIAKAEGTTATTGPAVSAKTLDNDLQSWWSGWIAAGATAEDLEAALADFEARGPLGMKESKTATQSGHYSVAVEAVQP